MLLVTNQVLLFGGYFGNFGHFRGGLFVLDIYSLFGWREKGGGVE